MFQGDFVFPLKERLLVLLGAKLYFEADTTIRKAVVSFRPPKWIGGPIGKTRNIPEC